MKKQIEEFTDAAAFLAAQRGQRTPRKAAKDARPDIPRAASGERRSR